MKQAILILNAKIKAVQGKLNIMEQVRYGVTQERRLMILLGLRWQEENPWNEKTPLKMFLRDEKKRLIPYSPTVPAFRPDYQTWSGTLDIWAKGRDGKPWAWARHRPMTGNRAEIGYMKSVMLEIEQETGKKLAVMVDKMKPDAERGKNQKKHLQSISSEGGKARGMTDEVIIDAFREYVTIRKMEGKTIPGINAVISHITTERTGHPTEYLPYKTQAGLFKRLGKIANELRFKTPTDWLKSL
jgi:hypothetical protein